MINYDEFKKESWHFYSQLKPLSCPALQGQLVIFSRAGFNHLVQKGRTPRPRKDQIRRFHLIPQIETVLKDVNATVGFRQGTSAKFWELTSQIGDRIVKVVIRQKRIGPKHFFSIMDN